MKNFKKATNKHLGELLIERGVINHEQLNISIEHQKKNPSQLLGEILVELKFATEKDWDAVLAPRYGKNFAAFDPAIQKVFAGAFEAKAFSVVSYCTVGKVTQKVYAVLEVTEPDKELSPKSVIFKVTKLYWL